MNATSPEETGRTSTMSQSILVVEDEEALALGIRDALLHVGYEVEVAHDGAAALEAVKNGRFDLVVLDIMLPGKSGLEVLRELRAERHDVRVVVLTALANESDDTALRAFRFANRSMAQQRIHSIYALDRRRGGKKTLAELDIPKNRSWRPFQLAFVLLSIPSLADPRHKDRTQPVDAPFAYSEVDANTWEFSRELVAPDGVPFLLRKTYRFAPDAYLFELKVAIDFFDYQLAMTIILMIFVLVLIVERLGSWVRNRIIEGN